MRIPKKITKCLVGQIDFSTFHVLDIVLHKAHGSVVFLLPKKLTAHSYYGMLVGECGHWYTSVGQMLDVAEDLGYIGRIRKVILRHRSEKIYKKQF